MPAINGNSLLVMFAARIRNEIKNDLGSIERDYLERAAEYRKKGDSANALIEERLAAAVGTAIHTAQEAVNRVLKVS